MFGGLRLACHRRCCACNGPILLRSTQPHSWSTARRPDGFAVTVYPRKPSRSSLMSPLAESRWPTSGYNQQVVRSNREPLMLRRVLVILCRVPLGVSVLGLVLSIGTYFVTFNYIGPRPPLRSLVIPRWATGLAIIFFSSHVLLGLMARRRARVADKRHELGLCADCGYDLRGSPGACPECGCTIETVQ